MKKILPIIFSLLTVLCICSCAGCGKQEPYPDTGIYYCDRLKLEIDFDKNQRGSGTECVKQYNNDGSYDTLGLFIAMNGNSLTIEHYPPIEGEWRILNGIYKWSDDIFTVTDRYDRVYTFQKNS